MEFLKILKNKKISSIILILLITNCLVFLFTQQQNIVSANSDLETYSAVYKENLHLLKEKNAKDILKENSDYYEILFFENAEDENFKLSKKDSALNEFYNYFNQQSEYQNNYREYIENISEKSKADLPSAEFFQSDFSAKSVEKSALAYSENLDLSLSLVNDKPIISVLNYQIGTFIIIVCCVLLVIGYNYDNCKILQHTSKNGRAKLYTKQVLAIFFFSVLFSVLVFGPELLISCNIYGEIEDIFAPVQSSVLFKDCVVDFNFAEFLIFYTFLNSGTAFLFSLVFWIVLVLFNSSVLSAGILGAVLAVQYLLYKTVEYTSAFSFFKTINIFSLIDFKSYLEYYLLSIFSIPVRLDKFLLLLLIFFTVVSLVVMMIISKKVYPIRTPDKLTNTFGVFVNRISIFVNKTESKIYSKNFESYKFLHIGNGVLLLLVFVLILAFGFNTVNLVETGEEMYLNEFYSKYSGEISEKTYEEIEKIKNDIDVFNEEFAEILNNYKAGLASENQYNSALMKAKLFSEKEKAYDKIVSQTEHLESVEKQGVKTVLFNELGYKNLFGYTVVNENQEQLFLVLCFLILFVSSAFSVEKNIEYLLRSTKNGRTKLFFNKLKVVFLFSFIFVTVSYFTRILQIHHLYGLTNLDADIRNLTFFSAYDFSISIGMYIAVVYIFQLLSVFAVSCLIFLVSSFSNRFLTIIISAVIILLPYVFYLFGIVQAKYFSAAYLGNINNLLIENDGNIAFLIVTPIISVVSSVVCIALSFKNWCKTKKR